jgi:hypothetical protein
LPKPKNGEKKRWGVGIRMARSGRKFTDHAVSYHSGRMSHAKRHFFCDLVKAAGWNRRVSKETDQILDLVGILPATVGFAHSVAVSFRLGGFLVSKKDDLACALAFHGFNEVLKPALCRYH